MLNVLIHAGEHGARWRERLQAKLPDARFVLSDEAFAPASIDALVGWNPPADFLRPLRRLRAVLALGAGVDGLLRRDDLDEGVVVARLCDAGMAEQMVEYALYGALTWQRHMQHYAAQQARGEWRPRRRQSRAQVRVGVLGLGALGAAVASELASFGYSVAGWSRSARTLPGVECRQGAAQLDPLLQRSDVLVNLLPSTATTRGLLDAERLQQLPNGAFLVQASRGDQLDCTALLQALDSGQLSGALLDVFEVEPLPADSPLWTHPALRITPHVAAITVLEDSVAQIAENLQRLAQGLPLNGLVDRVRGY